MSVITIPRNLRERLGEQGSDEFVELLNRVGDDHRDHIVELSGEKFERRLSEELSKVRLEMGDLRQELHTEIVETRQELHTEISKVRTEMHSLKAELIKWMFLFWAGQMAGLIGILFVFFKK